MAGQYRLMKETTGRCPECHAPAPAQVFQRDGQVFLQRTCPEHGPAESRISSDARFYNVSKGSGCCGDDCGCEPSGATSANLFEELSTCIALIEIVDSCNLACPTCFADSPAQKEVDCMSIENFKQRVQGVIDRKGKIEILQLSGGEPTLHPNFFEILEWSQSHADIDYVLVNTNGVRLANDSRFAEELDRRYKRGGLQLYLQFDGVQEAAQKALRGLDLRKSKQRAIEVAGAMDGGGLPITLAMTVTQDNLPHLWDTVEYGLQYSHIRGVAFQPFFESGRSCSNGKPFEHLNPADIILSLTGHSDSLVSSRDFTPLPCGDPNCHTIGYLLKTSEGIRSIADYVDFSQVQGFLSNRLTWSLEDLAQCGCDQEPLGDVLKQLEIDESKTFRLFIKPFMDAHSWDDDRIDRCCTHVIRPDGKLDSFCRYYSGFPDTWHGPKPASATMENTTK